MGDFDVGSAARTGVGKQRLIPPYCLTVVAPQARQRPARQRFARIPLALSVVQHTFWRETLPQTAQQDLGALALVRAERRGVPLGAVHIVDRDEGRLAAHCQAHVIGRQLGIDPLAECHHRTPLLVAVR